VNNVFHKSLSRYVYYTTEQSRDIVTREQKVWLIDNGNYSMYALFSNHL